MSDQPTTTEYSAEFEGVCVCVVMGGAKVINLMYVVNRRKHLMCRLNEETDKHCCVYIYIYIFPENQITIPCIKHLIYIVTLCKSSQ